MPLSDNREAFYRLESDLLDATGQGRNLTGSGDETYGTGKIGNGLTGGSGASRQFDEIDWTHGSGDSWSIFFWINLPSSPLGGSGGFVNVSKFGGSPSAFSRGAISSADSAGTARLALRRGASTAVSAPLVAGWHFTGMIYEAASGLAFWIDGTSTVTLTSSPSSNDATGILSLDPAGVTATPLDEIGVWSRALDATDIAHLYNLGGGIKFGGGAVGGRVTVTPRVGGRVTVTPRVGGRVTVEPR